MQCIRTAVALIALASLMAAESQLTVTIDRNSEKAFPWQRMESETPPEFAGRRIIDVVALTRISIPTTYIPTEGETDILELFKLVAREGVIASSGADTLPLKENFTMGILMTEQSIVGYLYRSGDRYALSLIRDYAPFNMHVDYAVAP